MLLRIVSAAALSAVVSCQANVDEPSLPSGEELDATFVANRIFVRLPVAADTLTLYTDTGGGLFLLGAAADRIGVGDSTGIRLSSLANGAGFPDPLGAPDGRVPLYRPDAGGRVDYDGMLGQAWFANRVWTIDYAGERLLLHNGPLEPAPAGSALPLWFRTDSAGARLLSFPRIEVSVDGDTLDMLLDTGATAVLTAASSRVLGNGPTERATSFITTEMFERWREAHSDWRVIAEGDQTVAGMSMIEVPRVQIGPHRAGPVWFTQRPDAAFHEYMAQWMDRPLDGAIGGNALGFFVLTIDYPNAVATVRRLD